MKVLYLYVIALHVFTKLAVSQLPSAERITSWSRAGIGAPLPKYNQIPFIGDTTGIVSNSVLLKTILDTLTQPTIILVGSGTYLFTSTIALPARTIIKGLGNTKTRFIFNLGGTRSSCISIRGTEAGQQYSLTQSAPSGARFIELAGNSAANFGVGFFFRLIQEDTDLIHDSWGKNNTGQIIKIDSVISNKVFFSSPLRMNYPLSRNPRIRRVNPSRFSGVECIKITRADNSNPGVGSSNFYFSLASDCWISSVESNLCNFAHVEAIYSTNLLIEDNYFFDAHGFGSGGRAYGVMLYYATGEVLVQNNIFRRLRHSMILQAGANGNAFAYNYSFEGRKEVFPGFFFVGEDLVCHGNYPYFNLFEGNYAQFASVDNSHGKNGPYNTFFRNFSNTFGFTVTNSESPLQNFTANQSTSPNNMFSSINHHITDNSWQGSSTLTHLSLLYQQEPIFLRGYGLGKIGPPEFNTSITIPARDRAIAQNFISNKCDVIIWENGQWNSPLSPSVYTKDYQLEVMPPLPLNLNGIIRVKSLRATDNSILNIGKNLQLVVQANN